MSQDFSRAALIALFCASIPFLLAATTASDPPREAECAILSPERAPRQEVTFKDWIGLTTSVLQTVATIGLLLFAIVQWRIARRTWKMQAAQAWIDRSKMRLETYLRGNSLPLSSQTFSFPQLKTREERQMASRILREICGDNPEPVIEAEVQRIIFDWFAAERAMDDLVNPQNGRKGLPKDDDSAF